MNTTIWSVEEKQMQEMAIHRKGSLLGYALDSREMQHDKYIIYFKRQWQGERGEKPGMVLQEYGGTCQYIDITSLWGQNWEKPSENIESMNG